MRGSIAVGRVSVEHCVSPQRSLPEMMLGLLYWPTSWEQGVGKQQQMQPTMQVETSGLDPRFVSDATASCKPAAGEFSLKHII